MLVGAQRLLRRQLSDNLQTFMLSMSLWLGHLQSHHARNDRKNALRLLHLRKGSWFLFGYMPQVAQWRPHSFRCALSSSVTYTYRWRLICFRSALSQGFTAKGCRTNERMNGRRGHSISIYPACRRPGWSQLFAVAGRNYKFRFRLSGDLCHGILGLFDFYHLHLSIPTIMPSNQDDFENTISSSRSWIVKCPGFYLILPAPSFEIYIPNILIMTMMSYFIVPAPEIQYHKRKPEKRQKAY